MGTILTGLAFGIISTISALYGIISVGEFLISIILCTIMIQNNDTKP